ncbi:hypothetical protein NPIL_50381 [Nephila pilipes]|uniref:Uncharacterized protein n=1 Tax=Nephila pilipes TaxID=299642 RepID=A0A8X6MMF0_NEPPI|nr:hypothetical protein NPIL_50381 [Nephila pilipes]
MGNLKRHHLKALGQPFVQTVTSTSNESLKMPHPEKENAASASSFVCPEDPINPVFIILKEKNILDIKQDSVEDETRASRCVTELPPLLLFLLASVYSIKTTRSFRVTFRPIL